MLRKLADEAADPSRDIQILLGAGAYWEGIGHLIRGFSDTGIVSIIDPRLRDKPATPYRDITWASLPIHNRTTSINELREFYHAVAE